MTNTVINYLTITNVENFINFLYIIKLIVLLPGCTGAGLLVHGSDCPSYVRMLECLAISLSSPFSLIIV